MTRPPQQPRRDIFTEFPATNHAGLIVRYAGDGAERLAHSFADAAERLASTFRGEAPDDALLMPFLYLYRHAIGLDLEYAIRLAARLRRNNGEHEESLLPHAVAGRLQKKHGHRLMALVAELDAHLTALDLATLPKDVRRLFTLISASDPSGKSFRYGSGLPNSQDQIDFPPSQARSKGPTTSPPQPPSCWTATRMTRVRCSRSSSLSRPSTRLTCVLSSRAGSSSPARKRRRFCYAVDADGLLSLRASMTTTEASVSRPRSFSTLATFVCSASV